jgi:hypothetical protein
MRKKSFEEIVFFSQFFHPTTVPYVSLWLFMFYPFGVKN